MRWTKRCGGGSSSCPNRWRSTFRRRRRKFPKKRNGHCRQAACVRRAVGCRRLWSRRMVARRGKSAFADVVVTHGPAGSWARLFLGLDEEEALRRFFGGGWTGRRG